MLVLKKVVESKAAPPRTSTSTSASTSTIPTGPEGNREVNFAIHDRALTNNILETFSW